jgi:hypothetical protein
MQVGTKSMSNIRLKISVLYEGTVSVNIIITRSKLCDLFLRFLADKHNFPSLGFSLNHWLKASSLFQSMNIYFDRLSDNL